MNHESADITTNPSLLLRLRDLQDRQAWGMFVEVYGPLIFSYCRNRKLQDSDAADVSQEVMKRISKAISTFEYQPERGRFRDWLGMVTHRELLQFWKRKNRNGLIQSAEDEWRIDHAEDRQGWDEHFHAELLQLAMARIRTEFEPETWRIFEQLWLDNQSAPEVSKSSQVSIGSVYVAKSRVLKRLREEVLMLSDDLPLLDRNDS